MYIFVGTLFFFPVKTTWIEGHGEVEHTGRENKKAQMKGSALGWQHDLTINTSSGNFISCILCVYAYIYINLWSHSKALQWKNVRFTGIPALRNGWMHPKDWALMDQDLRAKLMQKWSPTQKCVLLGKTEGPACCIISYDLLVVELGEASIHKPSAGKRTSKLLPSSTHVLMFYQVVHGLPSQSSLGSPLPCWSTHFSIPPPRSHGCWSWRPSNQPRTKQLRPAFCKKQRSEIIRFHGV